ncbi:unnamed protein product [Cylicocyclus nassatus]|uniref:Peptidase A1 domain-containing protein n=1 Tax=Cylicocyclus nassatus TaxID=53992 RepID=A0AA36H0R2_CYLNA|nr:unnamed protein product [Cylicocyclus nassatus]
MLIIHRVIPGYVPSMQLPTDLFPATMTYYFLILLLINFLNGAYGNAQRSTEERQLAENINPNKYVKKSKLESSLNISVPLHRLPYTPYYFHNVRIGNHDAFRLVISTHSSLLWVPHLDCTSVACLSRYGNGFNPHLSRSFVDLNSTFVSIDPLGNAKGILGSDEVQVGDSRGRFQVSNLTFGLAMEMETNELGEQHSGIVGLGLNDAEEDTESYIETLVNREIIEEPVFTIWLNPDTSASDQGFLTYGSNDNVHCGPIYDALLMHLPTYTFSIKSLSMGDYNAGLYFKAEVDLGQMLYMPPAVASAIAHHANAQYEPESNLYWIKCSAKFPDLILNVDHAIANETVRSSDLIIEVANIKNLCVLAVSGRNRPSFGPTLTLGAPFLRNYCAIFDLTSHNMRFAEALPYRSMNATNDATTTTMRATTFGNSCKLVFLNLLCAVLLLHSL